MVKKDQHWHLDKRVPISLIIVILVQTATIVWWASNIDARVTRLEENVDMPERMARVEQRLDYQSEMLGRIEKKLDRLR